MQYMALALVIAPLKAGLNFEVVFLTMLSLNITWQEVRAMTGREGSVE